MKTQVKEITPQWAKQVLETRNIQNRNISERVVDKYANDMLAGNWCLTHQGIAFDVNGDLLDGQHRLAAIVKANVPVKMLVTSEIPSTFKNNGHTTSVFTAIDGLKPRTNATGLELLAYKNSKLVASIARCAVMVANGASRDHAACISSATTIEVVKAFNGSIERIASLSTGSRIIRIRAAGLGVIAVWHTFDSVSAESFLEETQKVTGNKKSPSRSLASWITNHPGAAGSSQVSEIYVTCSAVYHAVHGNQVEKLYGSEDHLEWLCSQNRKLIAKILALFKL